jgi:hypothetical protein
VTSLREALRRLLGRDPGEAAQAAEFSYTIFWTREAQSWTGERREQVSRAVEAVTERPDFADNLYLRNYRVPGLDEHAYAGASLQALLKVLRALQDREEAAP